MKSERRKLAVVLGAGASYDVRNEGSTADMAWRPPLTMDLFNIAQRPNFEPILSYYPDAASLVQELAPLCHNVRGFDLEAKLREYAEHPDCRIRRQFMQIPPYIHDVIGNASDRYVRFAGCYAQLVKAVLADVPHDVAFIVLNYDDLLEQALDAFVGVFRSIDDYIVSNRQAMVIKIHGSIDWFHIFQSHDKDWQTAIQELDLSSPLTPVEVRKDWRREVPRGNVDQEFMWAYPVLTAPLAGKGPMSIVCPPNHVRAVRSFLAECEKVLVIGTSGQDDDLFELLSSSLRRNVAAEVIGVAGVADVLGRFCDRISQFSMARSTSYDCGFKTYLTRDDLRRFLER